METRSAKPGDLDGPVVNGLELRDALDGFFKDIDEVKGQVLVEFPHETVDSYKTKFGTRAFAESFEQKLPIMCWQHDLRDPIGRAIEAQVTPSVNEIRGQFSDFDAVPHAKRAFSQIADKTLTDFSFGFKNASYEPGGTRGVRRITKAYMAEFSPVTIGSIPGAVAVGLREDGAEMEYELGQLLHMRDSGLLTDESFGELIEVHFPELSGKINLRADGGGDSGGYKPAPYKKDADETITCPKCGKADSPDARFCDQCGFKLAGAMGVRDTGQTDGLDDDGDDDGDQGEGEMVQWTANDAGFHTATGPNGEAMSANRSGVWSVIDNGGTTIGSGKEEDVEAAKGAANGAVMNRADDFTWDGPLTAEVVRAAINHYSPKMNAALGTHLIAIEELGKREDGTSLVDEFAGSLATGLRAAVDNANAYFDEADLATLPEDIQQGIALVRSAGSAVSVLTDSLGIDYEPEDLEDRADDGDDGGSDDGDSSDPYSEAMSAFNDAEGTAKTAAARKVMSLCGKLKKPVPPAVLKAARPKGSREDDEDLETRDAEVEAKRAEALATLDRMAAKVKPEAA